MEGIGVLRKLREKSFQRINHQIFLNNNDNYINYLCYYYFHIFMIIRAEFCKWRLKNFAKIDACKKKQ